MKNSPLSLDKVSSTVTSRIFPVDKNKILVRFQNLADLVEVNSAGLSTQFVDIEQFAEDLFLDENQKKADNMEIQEMALQGVYPIDADKNKKIWWAKDDKSPMLQQLAQDHEGFKGIALEPQRMRAFQITYNQPQESLKASVAQKEKIKSEMKNKFAIRDMIRLNAEKF